MVVLARIVQAVEEVFHIIECNAVGRRTFCRWIFRDQGLGAGAWSGLKPAAEAQESQKEQFPKDS